MTTKFGLHVTQGSRNGYGDVVAAAPTVVLAVNEGGALIEAKEKSGGRTITIFREQTVFSDAPPNIDHMSEAEARQAADTWWPQLAAKYRQNPADYYQAVNETGGDNPISLRNIVAFEMRLMELAERDGYRLCVGNPAGGSPGSWELWLEFYVPLIRRAGQGGHIYGRHAYGGVEAGSSGLLTNADGSPADDNAGRPFREATYLREQGILTPIVITEAGQHGGFRFPGVDLFMVDMASYDALCREHTNIWGFCAWTYGVYQNGASNIEAASSRMREYLVAQGGAVRPQYPDPAIVEPGGEETRDERIWRISIEEQIAHGLQLAPTGIQDAIRRDGMHPVIPETYIDGLPPFMAAEDWSGGGKARRVYVWENGRARWFADPATTPQLALGVPLTGEYVVSSRFNDERSYANGKHEGVDFAPRTSGAKVVASAAGVVDGKGYQADGYGHWIRLRHSSSGLTYLTWYAHMAAATPLSLGTTVQRGAVLGDVGNSGRSSGAHVHLTLVIPGHGLDGYAVDDVVDPWPFLDLTPVAPTPPPPPATGSARLGLHASADSGELSTAEFALFALARPGAIKVLSSHGGPSVERLARDHPGVPFIVRAFLHFGGRNVSPAQFVEWTLSDVQRALAVAGSREIWVELHNEPNLVAEGLGASWAGGSGFSAWLLDVLARYRAALPAGVRYLFPGLSPGGTIGGVRADWLAFLEAVRPAVNACEGLAVHAYWHIEAGYPMSGALAVVDEAIRRFPGKPIWVTEASSKTPDGAEQGRQYVTFWQELRRRPAVRGVTFFVASASHPDFQGEVWLAGGQSRGIAEVVGAR